MRVGTSLGALTLVDQLRRAQKGNDGGASLIAQLFNGLLRSVSALSVRQKIENRLQELEPEIQALLRQNGGVMLKLGYDVVEQAPGEQLPAFVFLEIVGAGNDPAFVERELSQWVFRPAPENVLRRPRGCDSVDPFCKKHQLLIWCTRYYMEYR